MSTHPDLEFLAEQSGREYVALLEANYDIHYGVLDVPIGHFLGARWDQGTPVRWYIDEERGPMWPQVILPDNHVLTMSANDLRVTTAQKHALRLARLDTFIVSPPPSTTH